MKRLTLLTVLLTCTLAPASITEDPMWTVKTCDGSTTGFAFSFTIHAATDINVILVNTTTTPYTTTTLTPTTHYTLAVTNGRYPAAGGTITTVSTYSGDYRLVITTDIDKTSDLVLTSDSWSPIQIQYAVEKLTLIVNEHERKLAQTFHNPESLGITPTTEAPEYGSYGYWYRDAAGSWSLQTLSADANYPAMSNFWQGVVDESTLAASLDALGDPNAIRPALGLGVINVMDSPYLATGDGTTDDTAALQAALNAVPSGGTLVLPTGVYRFTANLTRTTPLRIIGTGPGSVLYPDCGAATDGLTLGSASSGSYGWYLADFAITGNNADSCEDALVLQRCYNSSAANIHICTDASGYGLSLRGVECSLFLNITIGFTHGANPTEASYKRPTNGILLEDCTALTNANTFLNTWVNIVDANGIDGISTLNANNNAFVGGGVQEVGHYFMRFKGMSHLSFTNFYFEDALAGSEPNITFDDCAFVTLHPSVKQYGSGANLNLIDTNDVLVNGGWYRNIDVDGGCYNVTISRVARYGTFGGDGWYRVDTSDGLSGAGKPTYQVLAKGDSLNFCQNTDFARWGATAPEGWTKPAAVTWTQCGVGLADTNNVITDYAAKAVFTSYTSSTHTLLDASTAIKALTQAGTGSFSIWCRTVGVPTNYPAVRVRVTDGAGNHDYYTNYVTDPNTWTHLTRTFPVETDTTDVQVALYCYGTVYVSCPVLQASLTASRSWAPARGDAFPNGLVAHNGATSAGYLDLLEDSDNGTSKVRLQAQAMASDYTITLPAAPPGSTQYLTMDNAGVLDLTAAAGTAEVEDTAYGAGWNGDATHAPSQNAVYDWAHIGDSDDDGKPDTLDDDCVAAAQMADADHGDVDWSGGVATVQGTAADAITSAMIGDAQAIRLLASDTATLNGTDKDTIYTVPEGKSAIVTLVIIRNPSWSLAGGTDYDIGDGASADTWRTAINLSSLTASSDCIILQPPTAKFTVYDATDAFGIKPVTGSNDPATATMMVYGIEF